MRCFHLFICIFTVATTLPLLFGGCGVPSDDAFLNGDPNVAASKYLYVASGACYGGGVTTSTASNTIVRYNLATPTLSQIVMDYTPFPSESIAGITDFNSEYLLVAIETGATSRRLDLVKKDGSGRITYLTNATAFASVIRGITYLSDGGVLVAETASIEKFGSSKARITQGANPYINAPAGNCATSTTNMVHQIELPNGKILFAHAGATPNNKIGIISASGYAAAGDCLISASVTGPTTTALPTAVLYHSSGDLIVAYGSTTATSNFIYAYNINTTSNAVTGATAAYNNISVVQGPSSLVENPSTGRVYVATSLSTFNTIEEFTYDASSNLLTRTAATPFINSSVYTRCVSGMVVSQ